MEQKCNVDNRTIFQGDNLYVMKGINDESIDLIYLDPPFNKKKQFSAPIGSSAEGAEFKDYWIMSDINVGWLIMLRETLPDLYHFLNASSLIGDRSNKYYLIYMAMRLIEMKRILKPTGSIYLHCDPTMSHYLKLLMDLIFGHTNYHNDITWERSHQHNLANKRFDVVTDNILFYSKSKDYFYKSQYGSLTEADLLEKFPHIEEETGRRYNHEKLEKSSNAYNKYETRVINGREVHTNLGWVWTQETFDKRISENPYLIYWTSEGKPRYKNYYDEYKGRLFTNNWTDIKGIGSSSKERTGYPTQKPLKLLQRIINSSAPENAIIFDPFCGCATTCIAAESLNRQWIGVDISAKAFTLVNERLSKEIKNDLFDLNKELHFRTASPIRTDIKEESLSRREIKKLLYIQQENKCMGCKTDFTIQNLEIDHIYPKSLGGSDSQENYQLLCSYCNKVKGDRPMEYLIGRIEEEKKQMQIF